MKRKNIFSVLGLVLIISLALALVPASPVSAMTLIVTPATGAVGTTVTIVGTGFTPSSAVGVYLTNQLAYAGYSIGSQITTYSFLTQFTADSSGTFTGTFSIPATLSTGSVAVTTGTYYLCIVTFTTSPTAINYASAFTITGGTAAITLSSATGAAGSSVTVTGSNFLANTILTFKVDSTPVSPTAGQTGSTSTGSFASTISIPSSTTAGAHTISVTDGTNTATATFTVTATAALRPLAPTSGPGDTPVMISGTNFPPSTALIFNFDTTAIHPSSGDAATDSNGIFISTITIPASASAGSHTITVTAGSIMVSATFTVTAPAALATLGALSPPSGAAGTDVTVSGSNFPPSTPLIFQFDSTTITPKSGTATSGSGTFTSTITIPSNATATTHTITVTAGTGIASASFTVTAAPVSTSVLSITSNGDNVGASIGLGGAGFKAGGTVTITFGGVNVKETTVDSSGTFGAIFQIPPGQHGAIPIVATDGTNTANTSFTVETTPPQVPVPIAPAMGASLKSPYLFDWNVVTDPSAPVTYDLQIATSPDFTTSSIVVNKTGLTESQYKLSPAEATQLSTNPVTYYWRERAEDAAANASAWTGAGQFAMGKAFKFTGWPVYAAIAIGALLFFLLGLWAGRRSAFSY